MKGTYRTILHFHIHSYYKKKLFLFCSSGKVSGLWFHNLEIQIYKMKSTSVSEANILVKTEKQERKAEKKARKSKEAKKKVGELRKKQGS